MNSLALIARRYLLPPALQGCISGSVIRSNMLSTITSANSLFSAASDTSKTLIAQAETDATSIKFEASMEAQRLVWGEAFSCLSSLDAIKTAFLANAQVALRELLLLCMSKLLLDVPDDAALQSSVNLLLQDWKFSSDAVLEVPLGQSQAIKEKIGDIKCLRVDEQANLANDECRLLLDDAELQTSFRGNVQILCSSLSAESLSDGLL